MNVKTKLKNYPSKSHPIQESKKNFRLSIPSIDADPHGNYLAGKILITIILLGAVLRFGYLMQLQSSPLPKFTSQDEVFDPYNYVTMAYDIMDHHFIGSKLLQQSPAYSYFLAVIFTMFGRDINYMFAFQILCGLVMIYLFYRTTAIVFENRTVGLIAAFLAAFYSPFIYYEGTILRDLPIGYSNLLAFYLLLKGMEKNKLKYFFLTGVVLGISTTLRPHVLILSAIYVFIVTKGIKQKFIVTLLLFLGVGAIMFPLAVRNSKITAGGAVVESSAPETFWAGNTFDSSGIGAPKTPTSFQLAAEANAGGSVVKNTFKILWREVTHHPKEYFDLYLRKLKMTLNGYEIPANFSYDLFKENHSILSIAFINFCIVSPLALLGMILAFGKYRQGGLLYVFVFLTAAFVVLFHIQSRYRMAFLPFFIIFAAYAIYWLYYMGKTKQYPVLGAAVLCLGIFVFYTKPATAIYVEHFGGRIRDIDYNNLVIAYIDKFQKAGDDVSPEEKRKFLEQALKYRKKSLLASSRELVIPFLLDLAKLNIQLGHFAEAKHALDQVNQFEPNNPVVPQLLQVIDELMKRK